MSRFTACAVVEAAPDAVITALVDAEALTRWSPVPFRVLLSDGDRLQTGCRARIVGSLAGLRAAFDVDVDEVGPHRLRLRALGPVNMRVSYRLTPSAGGTAVAAEVEVARGNGCVSHVLTSATEALLRGGALQTALRRLDGEARTQGWG